MKHALSLFDDVGESAARNEVVAQKALVRHLFGEAGESAEDTIRQTQVSLRALLHLAKTQPNATVSDPAVVAHVNAEIGRLDYALEILRGDWS